MSLERLAYLDHAFKTRGLSLGRPEADEMSRLEERLPRDAEARSPGDNERDVLRKLNQLGARPLTGIDAQVLLAMAQIAVARVFELPKIAAEAGNLDLPGLGHTAVRIALRDRSREEALRIESGAWSERRATSCAV